MNKSITHQEVVRVLLVGCFIFINLLGCKPAVENVEPEIDIAITITSASLIETIKAENRWLGFSNVGDIIIKVKSDKNVLPDKPTKKPDLSKLEKESGKFRMVSVGGALSAGFRDGGLYRAGQLTAFPAMMARQMGVNFVQPLFLETEGNGSGYKTIADTEPLVSYKMVINNMGVLQGNGETSYTDFAEKEKIEIDQIAFPEMNRGLQFFRSINPDNKSHKYLNRAVKADTKTKYSKPWDWINAQVGDLFVFEFGFDDTYQVVANGNGAIASGPILPYYFSFEFELMRALAKKQQKGVILNVPEILDFPYFMQITDEKIQRLGVNLYTERGLYNPKIDRLIPTQTTEKLLKGELKGKVVLADNDVITAHEADPEVKEMSPQYYNTYFVGSASKDTGWPVVDIYSLYKRIQAGEFTTDDGVMVNAAWPNGGNFFSADGIYPTAFGQAVIGNEVIKTLNKHYGLDIPLIQTRFFVGK